ncbi:uncharacterized protein [Venturia canescens]|uniref:uncharacterized protein n=1 Tax=Venturia canescens TaxID=32260 RepID=UPI001C9C46A3|nr:uncharacterized protein LOC122415287 [Venturia canescens]
MSVTKLGSYASRFAHRQSLVRRLTAPKIQPFFILKNNISIGSAKAREDKLDDLEKPVRFSTSEAAAWDPVASRTGDTGKEMLWYQPIVVAGSTIIFLIYFAIFREENDIDEKLSWNLRDHFTGETWTQMEKSQQISTEYANKGATIFNK